MSKKDIFSIRWAKYHWIELPEDEDCKKHCDLHQRRLQARIDNPDPTTCKGDCHQCCSHIHFDRNFNLGKFKVDKNGFQCPDGYKHGYWKHTKSKQNPSCIVHNDTSWLMGMKQLKEPKTRGIQANIRLKHTPKVRELISMLQGCDQNADVVIYHTPSSRYADITKVGTKNYYGRMPAGNDVVISTAR